MFVIEFAYELINHSQKFPGIQNNQNLVHSFGLHFVLYKNTSTVYSVFAPFAFMPLKHID